MPTRSIAAKATSAVCSIGTGCGTEHNRTIAWLQGITIAWMLVECAVALTAAVRAHSPVLLAFGADSLIELLSATVVILQFTPKFRIQSDQASRIAGILLFVLAGFVFLTSLGSLALHVEPDHSMMGIAITVAALIVMPVLSAAKQHMAEKTGNMALAADSIQSATCACLALITLAGLSANAVFHLTWIDPVAALAVTPILWMEGKRALRGETCGCC